MTQCIMSEHIKNVMHSNDMSKKLIYNKNNNNNVPPVSQIVLLVPGFAWLFVGASAVAARSSSISKSSYSY